MTRAADPWRCGICGTHHVVPALARDCETKHETAAPETAAPEQQQEVPQLPLGRGVCPSCEAPVLVLDLVDATGAATGERVVLDPHPTLHGFYRRAHLLEHTATELDDRRPGSYRPHHETCRGGR